MIDYLVVLQAFYRTGEGDSVISHKSDVWSGCVTMMDILVGKKVNEATVKHVRIKHKGKYLKLIVHHVDLKIFILLIYHMDFNAYTNTT